MSIKQKAMRFLRWSAVMLAAVMFSVVDIYAQNVKVSGRVTDNNGEPVIGASVLVVGTKNGTSTNVDGRYTITCPSNATLEYQCVGYEKQSQAVNGRSVINVVMKEEADVLSTAYITAEFGQKRVARAVGSSVQNIKASEVAEAGRESFVTALQGRVSGLNVVSSGGVPGASTNVVIRSMTSISGSNQPLYIVDGVPMNNSSLDPTTISADFENTTGLATRYIDYSSRGNDLDPDNIESMTILKGAAAAALYGSEASNGAIIITTKKGAQGKGRVQYSNSFGWSFAYGYPELQDKYANGAYGATNWYYTSRMGAPYPAGTKIYDNIDAVLRTGFSQKHTVSVEGGSDKVTMRANVTWQKNNGVVKTTANNRLNISLTGKAEVTKWLKFDSSFQYTNQFNKKALKGTSGPLYKAMQWPMVDDMSKYMDEDGVQMKLPLPYVDTDLLNPLFALYKNRYEDRSDRFLMSLGVNVTPTKHTFVSARFGWDIANMKYLTAQSPYYANRQGSGYIKSTGYYALTKNNYKDPNLTILAGYNNEFGKFSLSAQVGYHQTENVIDLMNILGTNFMYPDFYSILNCDPTQVSATTTYKRRRIQGLSGQIELGYNNMAYLTLRGRNDWSSTLPKDNNHYFYPAIEGSVILTELPFLKGNDILTYFKLRGAIAQVGKDASPLAIYPALEQTGLWMEGFDYGYYGPNLKLKPEMTTSSEIGFEARLFKDRVNIDFTHYWTKCKDQYVTAFRLSYATGFVLNNMNVGTFKTHGWEFHIDGDIVKTKDWRWNVGVNMDASDSKVTALPVDEYYNAYYWNSGNIRTGISVGHPITTLSGRDYLRNEKGDVLIDPGSGAPSGTNATWTILGDRNPKLRFGVTSSLSWKNFRLSVVFAGRYHATVVNGTKRAMMGNGTSWESVTLREGPSVIFRGVLKDGKEDTDHPTVNTIAYNYATGIYSGQDPDWIEKHVNYLRCQEVRLNYNVPSKWLKNVTHNLISQANVWVAANDLFVVTNYSGIDAVGNTTSAALGGTGGEGYDIWSIPNPRTLSFGISLTF